MMDRLESFDNDELMQFVKEPRIQMLGIGGAGNNILTGLMVILSLAIVAIAGQGHFSRVTERNTLSIN